MCGAGSSRLSATPASARGRLHSPAPRPGGRGHASAPGGSATASTRTWFLLGGWRMGVAKQSLALGAWPLGASPPPGSGLGAWWFPVPRRRAGVCGRLLALIRWATSAPLDGQRARTHPTGLTVYPVSALPATWRVSFSLNQQNPAGHAHLFPPPPRPPPGISPLRPCPRGSRAHPHPWQERDNPSPLS